MVIFAKAPCWLTWFHTPAGHVLAGSVLCAGTQASKLGVEVPQMGEIAAALAALQWTARVSAALAAMPSCAQPPTQEPVQPPLTTSESAPAAAEQQRKEACLLAEERLDMLPSSSSSHTTFFSSFLARSESPHSAELCSATRDGNSPDRHAAPDQHAHHRDDATDAAGSSGSQGGQAAQRGAPPATQAVTSGAVALSLADAEGLLEEGRALPVDGALLDQFGAVVRKGQAWEACLVGLVGSAKVLP